MNNNVRKEIVAVFDDDTKRCHRFSINQSEGIKGTIYFPKDQQVPGALIVHLRTKAEAEAEKKGER